MMETAENLDGQLSSGESVAGPLVFRGIAHRGGEPQTATAVGRAGQGSELVAGDEPGAHDPADRDVDRGEEQVHVRARPEGFLAHNSHDSVALPQARAAGRN